jgi:hypothetical protein
MTEKFYGFMKELIIEHAQINCRFDDQALQITVCDQFDVEFDIKVSPLRRGEPAVEDGHRFHFNFVDCEYSPDSLERLAQVVLKLIFRNMFVTSYNFIAAVAQSTHLVCYLKDVSVGRVFAEVRFSDGRGTPHEFKYTNLNTPSRNRVYLKHHQDLWDIDAI